MALLLAALPAVALGDPLRSAIGDRDAPAPPAITDDGAQIVVPYAVDPPALDVVVVDRKGAIVKTQHAADDAAQRQLYADLKPLAMTHLAAKNFHKHVVGENDYPSTHLVFDGLTVDLAPSSALTVQPKGGPRLQRSDPKWRTRHGELGCIYPAGIDERYVWIDVQRRAAVVGLVFYSDKDVCGDSRGDFAVFTW